MEQRAEEMKQQRFLENQREQELLKRDPINWSKTLVWYSNNIHVVTNDCVFYMCVVSVVTIIKQFSCATLVLYH